MTQGPNGSQASAPNNAPKPVRSPGWRPDPSQSKGRQPPWEQASEMQNVPGRDSGK